METQDRQAQSTQKRIMQRRQQRQQRLSMGQRPVTQALLVSGNRRCISTQPGVDTKDTNPWHAEEAVLVAAA